MKYYLIAGEASGDLHASNLMKSLKDLDKDADFRFYGGEKMAAVGGTLVKHYRELAYMGFIQVALHAGAIMRGMKQCKEDIVAWKPDVVILAEIYAARERNTVGISSKDIAQLVPGSVYCETLQQVTEYLRSIAQEGDVILTVGAGDIYRAGEALLK